MISKSTERHLDRVSSITSNDALAHASRLVYPQEYQEAVKDVRLLLEGRNTELAATLAERMTQASTDLRYEMAAKYRDLRKTVIKLSEQQKMATSPERDVDIFAYYREGAAWRCSYLQCVKDISSGGVNFLGGLAGRRLRSCFFPERRVGPVLHN